MPEEGPPAAEEEEETMPDEMYLQDDARSSTAAAAAAGGADDDGFGADEQAMLAGGHAPSRWNRCRFCCRICRKMSSEKRHVREHIIKDHGLSMPEYENVYGDCEVHTEYFFCGVCHAEVKHNLKNISLHLHNVHNITPPAYEEQFGRLVEEHAVIGHGGAGEQRGAGGGAGAHTVAHAQGDAASDDDGGEHLVIDEQETAVQEENQEGYDASHFLTVDHDGEEQYAENGAVALAAGVPPESDIKNPRNKFCRACNRDFNRRQAFVEHCRNIHAMKINFGSNGTVDITGGNAAPAQYVMAPPPPPPKPTAPISFPCEFCGKVFSNRSNRNRHKILSCDARREHLQAGGQNLQSVSDADTEDFGVDDEYPLNIGSEIKCPYPDCDVTQVRSALMKRHLFEAHHIQNISVAVAKVDDVDIKREPLDAADCQGSDEERKVPPLRVKLTGSKPEVQSAGEETNANAVVKVEPMPMPAPAKEFKQCTHCPYKNKNHYILDRHEKACLKRKMSTERSVPKDASNDNREETETSSEGQGQLDASDGKEEGRHLADADEQKAEDASQRDVEQSVTEESAEESCSAEVSVATETIEDNPENPEAEEQELPAEPNGENEKPVENNNEVVDNMDACKESTADAQATKGDKEDTAEMQDAQDGKESAAEGQDGQNREESAAEGQDPQNGKESAAEGQDPQDGKEKDESATPT